MNRMAAGNLEPPRGLDARILIVDDQRTNIVVLSAILQTAGATNVATETSPHLVIDRVLNWQPDLVLLDLHMPGKSGYELLEELEAIDAPTLPMVIVVTADDTQEATRQALRLGANDLLIKPVDPAEMLLRIDQLLSMRFYQNRLRARSSQLESQVRLRTAELEAAHKETLARLAVAAEYRDDETGRHAQRVGMLAAVLAQEMGLDPRVVELMEAAAALHDVGKIGIPDNILLKPGSLTPAEFAVMQTHTTIGFNILKGSEVRLLRLAAKIALSHHERWDGEGYPQRLRGDSAPVVGRIVAVADAFDAMTHLRPYRRAMSIGDAAGEILKGADSQFDPRVVDAFQASLSRLGAVSV